MSDALTGSSAPLQAHVENGIGFVALNRPKSLNALSWPMIDAMRATLGAWRDDPGVHAVIVHSPHARAFSAGADVRYLYELAQRGDTAARERYFIDEYTLDHTIFTYPKPYIALLNGIVMGGGMGIAMGARHTGGLRVVTQDTRMAMPETRIGLFTDVGAGWFLSRAPGALGRYLAVTGATIREDDARVAGLADVALDARALPALFGALRRTSFGSGAEVVDCVIDACARAPCPAASEASDAHGQAPLAKARPWIDRHFGQPDVAAILASLEGESEPDAREWAARTAALMRQRSPLAMAVSLELVTRAQRMTLADCLRCDLDLTCSSFERGDVIEGVRARLIDKDDRPRWRIARSEDVSRADIERMFASPWHADAHPLRALRD